MPFGSRISFRGNIPEYLCGIQADIVSDIRLCPSAYLFNHSFT